MSKTTRTVPYLAVVDVKTAHRRLCDSRPLTPTEEADSALHVVDAATYYLDSTGAIRQTRTRHVSGVTSCRSAFIKITCSASASDPASVTPLYLTLSAWQHARGRRSARSAQVTIGRLALYQHRRSFADFRSVPPLRSSAANSPSAVAAVDALEDVTSQAIG